jgi:hypothetical protein
MNDSIIADENLIWEVSQLNEKDPQTELDEQIKLNYQEELYEQQRKYYELAEHSSYERSTLGLLLTDCLNAI